MISETTPVRPLKILYAALCLLVILTANTSCRSQNYTAPGAVSRFKEHKTIAVIPAQVYASGPLFDADTILWFNMPGKEDLQWVLAFTKEKTVPEDRHELVLGFYYQNECYTYLKNHLKDTPWIQNSDSTSNLIGQTYRPLPEITPDDYITITGADAVLMMGVTLARTDKGIEVKATSRIYDGIRKEFVFIEHRERLYTFKEVKSIRPEEIPLELLRNTWAGLPYGKP